MPRRQPARPLSLLLSALLAGSGSAMAQAQAAGASPSVAAPASTTVPAPDCIAPADLQALHLYGLWRAEFDDGERSSLLFERHPEHPGSLRGAINRQGTQSRLAGDVDDGELVLDESDDGQRISAVWVARAVPQACGREFRGERRLAQGAGSAAGQAAPASRRFVLRRVPGWN